MNKLQQYVYIIRHAFVIELFNSFYLIQVHNDSYHRQYFSHFFTAERMLFLTVARNLYNIEKTRVYHASHTSYDRA